LICRNSGVITIDLIEFEPSLANRQKLSLTFQNVEAVRFQEVRAEDIVQVSSYRGQGNTTASCRGEMTRSCRNAAGRKWRL
jgi:hypothetical protein